MKIVILGAAGRTGSLLVQQALTAGHSVTAFVRAAKELDTANPSVRLHVGDARNAEDLKKAFVGQEAVISTLGSNKPGDNLMVESTEALLKAMRATGIKRVIMMSSFLASPNFRAGGIAKIVSWLMRPFVKDKVTAEDLLKRSNLDWTIVYATRLDGAKPGGYRVVGPKESVGVNNAIARADVADFLLKQLSDKTSIQTLQVITAK